MNEQKKIFSVDHRNEIEGQGFEVEQSPENTVIITAIVINAIIIILSAIYISYLDEWGWFLIVVGGLVLIQMAVRIYLRIFKSPQIIVLENNTLSVSMFFGNKILLDISEVERMKYDGFLSLFMQSGGWLIAPQRNLKLFVGKPFYNNFDEFVAYLRRQNPKCVMDYRLTEWHGRKRLSW
jgi:hypothetical protein